MVTLSEIENWEFTGNNHHADSENSFVVSFSSNVSKTDGSHARHCEVQRGDVHSFPGGAINKFRSAGVVGPHVRIGVLGDIGQLPKPIVLDVVVGIGATN